MQNRKPQVLVVDDEPLIRHQLARALDSVGIVCECASDGEDAFNMFANNYYPLVVTDLRMPGTHGHKLAMRLLELPYKPRIIVLTGIAEPRIAKDLMHHGASDIVYKPVNYFGFANRLKNILEGHRTEKATSQSTDKSSDEESLHIEPQIDTIAQPGRTISASRWIVTALRWIDWRRVPNLPLELSERFVENSNTDQDDSSAPCHSGFGEMSDIAIAIPLNNKLLPVGKPYKLFTHQISRFGCSLGQALLPNGTHLAIAWKTRRRKRIIALLRIVSSITLPFGFELECSFVSKASSE